MTEHPAPEPKDRLAAMCVHALTASGAVCALLAVRCTIANQTELAFAWLGLALIIDGIDGTFARRFQVKTVLPHVSGEVLDLCVDYVTYVFVPTFMLLQSGKLDGTTGLGLAALICITALYHFADTSSKTDDHYFVGFPAIWNIVAFYVFALDLPGWATASLILVCAALTFVRWRWVHPMRVTALRTPTVIASIVWGAASLAVLWGGFPAHGLAYGAIVLVAIYGIALSLYFGRA